MPLPGSRLRALALLVAGAEAVHQARYHLVDPAHSSEAAAAGHSYLHLLTPIVVGVLAIAAVEFVLLLALVPPRSPRTGSRPRMVGLWGGATAALLAVYAFQETVEGLLGSGHAAGPLARIFGTGGWVVILLALAIGGLISLLLRGSAAALERVAIRRRDDSRAPRTILLPSSRPRASSPNPIAHFTAGRGPPLIAV